MRKVPNVPLLELYRKHFPPSFDFLSSDLYLRTKMISGDTGSGKTSAVVTLILEEIRGNRKHRKHVCRYKNILTNIDSLDVEKLKALSVLYSQDVNFCQFEEQEFFEFVELERKYYQEAKSVSNDHTVYVLEKFKSLDDDRFIKYIDNSLIVLDEVDAILTSLKPVQLQNFANYMKWKRHYGTDVIIITQKFQNLPSKIYNAGFVNFYYRIVVGFGGSKHLEHWSNSNTSTEKNLENVYKLNIASDAYDYYAAGGKQSDKKDTMFKMSLFALPFLLFVIYFSLSSTSVADLDDQSVQSSSSVLIVDKKKDSINVFSNASFSFFCNYTDRSVSCSYDDDEYFYTYASSSSFFVKMFHRCERYSDLNTLYVSCDKSFLKYFYKRKKIKKIRSDNNESSNLDSKSVSLF